MSQKVHIAIILDGSGSMKSCQSDAIATINDYLDQVRGDPEMEARISLVTFNSTSIEVIRDRVGIQSCLPIEPREYRPSTNTPLLDALGSGVTLLDGHAEPGERCILAILTDGLENASRKYTYDSLKTVLERKQNKDGWLVIYLGADHDSWSQAKKMGLAASKVVDFDKSNIRMASTALYSLSSNFTKALPNMSLDSIQFSTDQRQSLKSSPTPPLGVEPAPEAHTPSMSPRSINLLKKYAQKKD